jgi:protein-S-isoprenylcysteine O-methyltransferase Ste14
MALKKAKPSVYVLATLAAMLMAHLLVPIARIITYPWNLFGVAPLLLGVALTLHALRRFGRIKTTAEPFGVSAALVTSGPFRFTRNPMYVGILLMLSGIACLLETVGPCLVVPLLGVVFDVIFVQQEEEKLEMKFGDDFRRYKAKVRRWI